MNELLQKFNDYSRLNNCRVNYILSNDTVVEFKYKKQNFIHLIGLHKLTDIQLIQFYNDKNVKNIQSQYVISRIKQNKFTDSMIKNSVFFKDIENRYNNFCYENLTTLIYTDAVISFNPKLINSKLNSQYILFEEKGNKEYNHLGIALDRTNNNMYAETF